jgi:beta-galactosidase/beta-glucuronidase
MHTTRQILSDGWRVREVPPDDVPEHNHLPWLPAQVPGHVHLDLMRAGVIPDPFARMHERAVAWVDDRDWVYETTFTVEEPAPVYAFLEFQGLDTVAEIELNGERLGESDNMLVPHEFPVGGRLKIGENTLCGGLRRDRSQCALGLVQPALIRAQSAVYVRLGLGAGTSWLRFLAAGRAGNGARSAAGSMEIRCRVHGR